jgi:hypothetical protein
LTTENTAVLAPIPSASVSGGEPRPCGQLPEPYRQILNEGVPRSLRRASRSPQLLSGRPEAIEGRRMVAQSAKTSAFGVMTHALPRWLSEHGHIGTSQRMLSRAEQRRVNR